VPLILRLLIALAVALAIYLLAVRVIRALNRPGPPDEPDPATLRPVDYRYRCGVCGAEVTMTSAPGEDAPDPPRHCKEDMSFIAGAG
jgi:hypothetical protein